MTTTESKSELAKTKDLLAAAGRINAALAHHIDQLTIDLVRRNVLVSLQKNEIARLKHRVNRLIRKNQSRRSMP